MLKTVLRTDCRLSDCRIDWSHLRGNVSMELWASTSAVVITRTLTTAHLIKWFINSEITRSLKISGIDLRAMIKFGRNESFDYYCYSSVFLLSLTSLAYSDKYLNVKNSNNLIRILNSLSDPSSSTCPFDTSVVWSTSSGPLDSETCE